MKKTLQILALLFLCALNAQAPEKFSYQAVIRNASNALITNANVGVKISILKTTNSGAVVYSESQTLMTNSNGLISAQIGDGTVLSGNISTINWGTDSYFIKTETDPAGGTNYTISGTSQLLSVPYAMYSKSSGSSNPTLTLPYSATTSNAASLFQISNNGDGASLEGINNSTTASISAVKGIISSITPGGFSSAVRGINNGTGGLGIGVYGSQAGSGWGVYGTTPSGIGVYGNASGNGIGGYFLSNNTGHSLVASGPLQLSNISEGAGKVLTSDALGNATWQNLIVPDVHITSLGGSNQVLSSTAFTDINTWTGLNETGGANYNPATGEYTIPVDGYYSVKVQIGFNSAAISANDVVELAIRLNSSTNGSLFSQTVLTAGQTYKPTLTAQIERRYVAGDKIKFATDRTGPASLTLQANLCTFSIHLIHL